MNQKASFRGRRVAFVAVALQVAIAALALRLVQIQVLAHQRWAERAERLEQDFRVEPFRRGMIMDCGGRQLAVSVPSGSVFANPRAVPSDLRDEVSRRLSELLDMPEGEVLESLSRVTRTDVAADGSPVVRPNYFVWIRRQVPWDVASKVICEQLPGVGVRMEYRRVYPRGRTLAHLLGCVGTDGCGLEGIEEGYDYILGGRPGESRLLRDGLGRPLREPGATVRPVCDGRSLVLTVDSRVQHIVEEELASLAAQHRPESACAVVMEPYTGDILAMAVWPDFDPNSFSGVSREKRRNMAVIDCFEPGSTFKPFTVAAALERGLVTPETQFDCHQGSWRIGRRVLHDAHPYGVLSVRDIVVYSSNIGVSQVGMRLGRDALYESLRAFGFGSPTGIGLPGESPGILRPPSQWNSLSLPSISMGQEVACTPLQLVAGFCVFANGGWYVRPRIVKAVMDSEGRRLLWSAPRSQPRRVISEETARLMREDLLAGVVERGTARQCAVPGYSMGGKTGTAQIAHPSGGGYEPGAYTGVFVGMAPVEAPRVVVGVVVRRPRGSTHYGGIVAAPAAARMIERILSLYGVPRASRSGSGMSPAAAIRNGARGPG